MCSLVFICWNFFTLSTSVCLLWEIYPTTLPTKRMRYMLSISPLTIVAQRTLESVGTFLSYSGLFLLNLINILFFTLSWPHHSTPDWLLIVYICSQAVYMILFHFPEVMRPLDGCPFYFIALLVITRYWILFPVLYSKSLLLICFIFSSL